MVAYVPDAYDAFESMKKEPFPHNKDAPIAIHADGLVCKGVAASVISSFNEHVKKQ